MTSKFALSVLAGLVTATALAQTPATTTTTTTTTEAPSALASPVSVAGVRTRNTTADRIVMANGALVEITGTRAARIDLDTILPGGARVTPGGTVTFSDGTTATMRDGQMLTMDGKVSAASPDFVAAANTALDAGTTGAGQRASDRAAGARAAATASAMPMNQ